MNSPASDQHRAGAARSRWKLGLIAALFLLPFTLAVMLRFGGWEPPKTRNFGELLQPPLPMHDVQAHTADGASWRWQNTDQHWTLLARLPTRCDADCRARLDVLPNVHEALGRHADRLTLFRIDPAGDAAGHVPAEHGESVALPPLVLDGTLPGPLAQPATSLPEVVLIDPHGYLVLYYPAGFDPSGLRKDLARLLR